MNPIIIAEIGINHNGEFWKAWKMVYDAYKSGCKVVKFQCHIADEEMTPEAKNIIPSNADENIYDMMVRCSLSEEQDAFLKWYTEHFGMSYLSTPFSIAAVDRLERLGVRWYKIGSGECNNYPLIESVAMKGKPVILSTGMNNFDIIDGAVSILKRYGVKYALMHCVSLYPTPYDKVNLHRIVELRERYHVPVGFSDHSIGIYTALGAVALGARIIEKHFVSDRTWEGPDVPISITPEELQELIIGASAISRASHGSSEGQERTAEFAFACVVSTTDIRRGSQLSNENIGVKRPGTGMIPARNLEACLGRFALQDIPKDSQLEWSWIT